MVQIELFSYLRTVTEKFYLVKENERFANRVAIRRSYSLDTFKNIVNININFYLKRKIRSYLLYLPKSILSDQQYDSMHKLLSNYKTLK